MQHLRAFYPRAGCQGRTDDRPITKQLHTRRKSQKINMLIFRSQFALTESLKRVTAPSNDAKRALCAKLRAARAVLVLLRLRQCAAAMLCALLCRARRQELALPLWWILPLLCVLI